MQSDVRERKSERKRQRDRENRKLKFPMKKNQYIVLTSLLLCLPKIDKTCTQIVLC